MYYFTCVKYSGLLTISAANICVFRHLKASYTAANLLFVNDTDTHTLLKQVIVHSASSVNNFKNRLDDCAEWGI